MLVFYTLLGCAPKNKDFKLTENEMFEMVAQEVPLGTKLTEWLKSTNGYSCKAEKTDCPKSIILMNMEKDKYQNDQRPESVLHDVLVDRFTDPEYKVRILDRDKENLGFIYKEVNKLELPEVLPTSQEEIKRIEEYNKEQKERQESISLLISNIANILSPQDSLFFKDIVASGKESATINQSNQPVVSSEIGKNKSELLQYLVDQYIKVNSCSGDFCQPKQTTPSNVPVVDVEKAEYLFAYRVYNMDDTFESSFGKKIRKTRMKVHIRVVNVKTGEIEVADTLEHEVIVEENAFKKMELDSSLPELNPYSSLELSLRPYALNLDVLQDPNPSLVQGTLSAHVYSKQAIRGSLGLGLGYASDKNDSASGGESLYSNTLMWSGSAVVSKVLFPRKAVKGLIGVGVNYADLTANEEVKGRTLTDPNGETVTEENSIFQLKSNRADVVADVGIIYSFKRLSVEFGYQYPLYQLYSGSSIDINDNTDILNNSYVPDPTIRLGIQYSFCGVIPLPNAFGFGQSCQQSQ